MLLYFGSFLIQLKQFLTTFTHERVASTTGENIWSPSNLSVMKKILYIYYCNNKNEEAWQNVLVQRQSFTRKLETTDFSNTCQQTLPETDTMCLWHWEKESGVSISLSSSFYPLLIHTKIYLVFKNLSYIPKPA